MSKRINKSTVVRQWWENCLDNGSQLPWNIPHPTGWLRKVDKDDVWRSFDSWAHDNYPTLSDEGQFTQNGFFTVFYKVTSASRTTKRVGGIRTPYIKFQSLTAHKKLNASDA